MNTNSKIFKIRAIAIIRYCLVLRGFIFFISCLGIKALSLKSEGKLHKTFNAGEEGTQYFIKHCYLIIN